MGKIELKIQKLPKMSSIEETIQLARLQQAVSASALYERKHNQKALKVLTVAAYILFVSMAAIILSFYYVFIWDPTSRPVAPRAATNCGMLSTADTHCSLCVHISFHSLADTPRKILIPESLAIQLTNSSEISADKFFRTLFRRYQKLQRQKERENRLLRKALKHSTKSPQSQPEVVAVEHNDIDFVTENIVENRNETQTGDATQSGQPNEQNVYMDDEDMVNDYDESESSGANRLQFNETSSVYIYDDND